MRRRDALAALVLAGLHPAVPAQPQGRRRLVAVVAVGALDRQPIASLIEELRALGHIEGKGIEFQPPTGEPRYAHFSKLAATAVQRKADVIVSFGTTATRAVLKATDSIPVVFVVGTDPVALGFTTNLARPVANATGFATATQALVAKRLELLREVTPRMRGLAVLWNPDSEGQKASLKMVRDAAGRLGIQVRPVEIRSAADLDGASRAASGVDALIAVPSTSYLDQAKRIVRVAEALRIPAVYTHGDFVDAGGLMSYSPDLRDQFRRAAGYVDRILKGAKPGELPVEQPVKYEMVVNLRTARALGITIPHAVLLRANRVIE